MMAEAATKTAPRRVVVRNRTTVRMGRIVRRTVLSSDSKKHKSRIQNDAAGVNRDHEEDVPKNLVEPSTPFTVFAFEMLIVVVIAAIFVLQMGLHVHRVYLHPYIETIRLTEHRRETERTYPAFACKNAYAVSNAKPADIFISRNATVEQAVDQVMLDGAAVFPDFIVAPPGAKQLREYLLARPSDQEGFL
jgi:hypothetical protein